MSAPSSNGVLTRMTLPPVQMSAVADIVTKSAIADNSKCQRSTTFIIARDRRLALKMAFSYYCLAERYLRHGLNYSIREQDGEPPRQEERPQGTAPDSYSLCTGLIRRVLPSPNETIPSQYAPAGRSLSSRQDEWRSFGVGSVILRTTCMNCINVKLTLSMLRGRTLGSTPSASSSGSP